MAAPSLTYSLVNGATADASQVMQNFNDLLLGYTDGTKDLSISALTCAGTATLNGHVNLGNASADDLTVTASLASTIPIKTTNTYDIGSSTLGLRAVYLGANSQTVKLIGSSTMSATWTFSFPPTAGSANQILFTNGSGVSNWVAISDSAFYASGATGGTVSGTTQTFAGVKTFSSAPKLKGVVDASSATAGDVGETLQATQAMTNLTGSTGQYGNVTSVSLTAGDWIVSGVVDLALNGGTCTGALAGLSAFSANTTTDHVTGDNIVGFAPPTALYDTHAVIPTWKVNISSTATYYLKCRAAYTGTPQFAGRITAIRVR